MRTKYFLAVCMVATLMSSTASAAVLTATFDSWVRDDGATANDRDNDLVTVSSTTSLYGPTARYGILEFDLSSIGVPITSAYLQLWNQATGSGDDTRPADQTATLINPVGAGAAGVGLLDWAGINSAIGAGTALTQMGDITIPPVTNPTFVNTAASAADLIALEADRNGDQLATFVLVARELGTDVSNTWGDNSSMRALLTINEAPFVPPVPPLALSGAIWARATGSFLNDGVIVTNNSSVIGDAPTVGLMEWDLTHPSLGDPANLVGATLELFSADSGRTANPGQIAGLIDTTGGTVLAGITSEPAYQSEYGGTELLLEGLGVVPDTTGPIANGESIVTTATAADLQLIRNVMNGTDRLTIAMRGSDFLAPDGATGQYWGDGHYGHAPILTLMFAEIPEPSSIGLIVLCAVCLNLTGVRRR